MVAQMNRKIANLLLDKFKDGQPTSPQSIEQALRWTGDIPQKFGPPDLASWIERRKTIRLAKSKAVGL